MLSLREYKENMATENMLHTILLVLIITNYVESGLDETLEKAELLPKGKKRFQH